MGGNNCQQGSVQECIEKKAYELWEKDGRKQGRDLEYWLKAEKVEKTKTNKNNSSRIWV